MPQGDAFNRNEVSSIYVKPTTRYVVSLIVGFDDEGVGSPAEAVAAALQMTRGRDRKTLVWQVHDRETGDTQEVEQKLVDAEESVPSSESA